MLHPPLRHAVQSLEHAYLLLTIAAVALSFGPVVRDWQGESLGTGPYYWLQQLLPGIDGLRAPARFGLVAAIALGVIAGFGATSLLASLPATGRRLVLMIATLFILVEAWPVGFTIEPFSASGRPADQPLDAWLRQQPASSMVELPSSRHMVHYPNGGLIYQYQTLNHPHALVNGSSGFHSPLADLIEGDTSPFRDPKRIAHAVLMLQTIAVRYVAVHTADYVDLEFAAQVVNALRTAPGLVAHRQFGSNHLFELDARDGITPNPPPRFPPISHRTTPAQRLARTRPDALRRRPSPRFRLDDRATGRRGVDTGTPRSRARCTGDPSRARAVARRLSPRSHRRLRRRRWAGAAAVRGRRAASTRCGTDSRAPDGAHRYLPATESHARADSPRQRHVSRPMVSP